MEQQKDRIFRLFLHPRNLTEGLNGRFPGLQRVCLASLPLLYTLPVLKSDPISLIVTRNKSISQWLLTVAETASAFHGIPSLLTIKLYNVTLFK
jgi:hypothetical protein